MSGDQINITWLSNKPDIISTNGTVNRSSNDVSVDLTATVTVGSVNRSVTFNITVIHASTPAPIIPSEFTVAFIDYDGSEIEIQTVKDEEPAIEPEEPQREGYIFTGWLDANGSLYNFDSPVYEDIALAANYAELEEVTENEFSALRQSVDVEGIFVLSFDVGSPITDVNISYDLSSAGTIMINLISQDPMLGTSGLLSNPIDIKSVGGNIKKADITFGYSPELIEPLKFARNTISSVSISISTRWILTTLLLYGTTNLMI